MTENDLLKQPEKVLYPNQPLTSVSCEIRFKGDLSIEVNRYEFQKRLRDKYEKLYVPGVQEGKPHQLQHYRFGTNDDKETVLLAINSIGYVQNEYKGFDDFFSEAVRIFKIALELFDIRTLTRIGWRYTNIIKYVEENGSIPIKAILDKNLPCLTLSNAKYKTFNFETTLNVIDVSLLYKLHTVSDTSNTNNRALMLDIDTSIDENADRNLELNKFDSDIEYLHRIARNVFESSINDKYRNYLKGDAYD